MSDLNAKWMNGTLTVKDIREYLQREARPGCSEEVIGAVTKGCHDLYEWSTKGRPLGGFCQAVRDNNLMKAFQQADVANQDGMYLYTIFLFNVAPMGWNLPNAFNTFKTLLNQR